MKLTDLNPKWCGHGGEGSYRRGEDGELHPIPERHRIGLLYDCPCGCGDRRYVPFENPEDGLEPLEGKNAKWQRGRVVDGVEVEGSDFETLTLSPSILHVAVKEGDCTWHGFIENGEVRTV